MAIFEGRTKCPACGSYEVGTGVWDGYAVLRVHGKAFGRGSRVLVQVCSDCGYLFDMRAAKPEVFQSRHRDED